MFPIFCFPNAVAVILGIANFSCISDSFLWIHSLTCNYTLGQKDRCIFKVLGTYYQIAFPKGCVNLHFPKKYVRGTFVWITGR